MTFLRKELGNYKKKEFLCLFKFPRLNESCSTSFLLRLIKVCLSLSTYLFDNFSRDLILSNKSSSLFMNIIHKFFSVLALRIFFRDILFKSPNKPIMIWK